ncbi:MAG: ATP synthase F0 subunit B, partial [Proteobacteria bacterium]|nr:ATP synthase F0 subunit B [Pseudomonadota bacterium]
LENASRLLQQAESRFAEWQGKLADLDQELEQLRAVAQRRAQEERNQILADARSTAERIERDAVAAVDQEIRRARTVLREEAADLAVELAAELLREQVGDDDRERLIDEFIARVDEVEKSGARGSAEDEAGR